MSIKYVGKPSKHTGKVLFDILCNLKDFGKGRVVVRNVLREQYGPTEPCFHRVVRAEPEMNPDNLYGVVWVESVFRGVPQGITAIRDPHIRDFQLLSKEEEAEYCKNVKKDVPVTILPTTAKFPPLFKVLVLRDHDAQGLPKDEEPLLPLVYEDFPKHLKRPANPGEQPTYQLEDRVAAKIYLDSIDTSGKMKRNSEKTAT